jgi:phage terminase large subunit
MSPLRDLGATVNESELRVDYPNHGQVRLYGADNADSLRGIYLDGVVLDEFADMDPRVWSEIIRPALADRQGWAVFIGTPKGRNAFYTLHQQSLGIDPNTKQFDQELKNRWFSLMLKASETGLISTDELQSTRRDLSEDQYQQEFECSFDAAIQGAFYADELRRAESEGRIGKVPIDRALLVHTAWDLGVTDSTAIWFVQCVGKERRLVDYYEASGVGFDVYAKVLKEKGYNYGDHYFPHDVQAHELSSGTSRVDTLRGLGIEPVVVPMSNVMDGINAVRRMLDSTWIDKDRCVRGLDALKQYRREYDDKLKDWKLRPLHDWSSHGADALRTFAGGFEEKTKPLKLNLGRSSGWLGN